MVSEGEGDDAVVIPANASVVPLACLRSLGKHDIRTVIAADDSRVPVCSSRYCTEVETVTSPYDDIQKYKADLLSLARRADVRTIIPIREEDVYLLSRYRSEFSEHISVVVPPYETLRVVHDRYRLVERAADLGIPVPETRLLTDVTDWNDEYIIKPRFSILTDDYVDTHRASESDNMRGKITFVEPGKEPDFTTLDHEMVGHVPIVQESVPIEHEYMYSALFDQGEEVASWQQRYLRRKTYGAGGSVYRESVHEPALEQAGRKLLDGLDWHGTACVEFMKDANTGEFKLTEVNPRLWGSLPCAIRAGADFPYYHWLLATGQCDRIEPDYVLNVATHSLYGELSYLESVRRDDYPFVDRPSFRSACWDVITSFARDPQIDYLDRSDPKPFFSGLFAYVFYPAVLGLIDEETNRPVEEQALSPN